VLEKLDRGEYLGYGGQAAAKAAIISLFLDLIAEAKPEKYGQINYYKDGVDDFEKNLKQAIDGGKK
jgi:hypothetical protein